MVSSDRLPPAASPRASAPDERHLAAQREFAELSGALHRIMSTLNVTADALERAQLASELRNVQLEIDAYQKRHDSRITPGTRKYLAEASLQVEIRLTAMAARSARHRRSAPRRRPS